MSATATAPPARAGTNARGRMRLWYRFWRVWCVAGFALFFRGRSYGAEHVRLTGGVLIVSNHQSFLDPILATVALRRECDYMARDSLFRNRWFRWLIESLNAFPVRRGSADIGAIKETLRRLRAGRLITVFPEGTRTHDGSIGPLHPGVVLIARKAGVPIVPTVILGAFEAWPRTAKLPRPGRIVVAYDAPLYPADVQHLSDEELLATVRERMCALQERYGRARTGRSG